MISCEKDRRLAIELTVDGTRIQHEVSPRMLLSDFLRAECAATGVHVGCEHGVCGACTVRLDGRAVRSCLLLAVQADGAEVETVAALGSRDALSPLQESFRKHHALQCGFCTPGILISAVSFLAEHPEPDERAVRELLSGHLCRCTGYAPIVAAIMEQTHAPDRGANDARGEEEAHGSRIDV